MNWLEDMNRKYLLIPTLALPNTKFLSLDVPTLHMSVKLQIVVHSADKSFQFN